MNQIRSQNPPTVLPKASKCFMSSVATNCVCPNLTSRFFGCQHDLVAIVIWHGHAPLRCKFFAWLAMKNRCWTSDSLARCGLPHQVACRLCDQEQEMTDHILVSCVFARSVWYSIMLGWARLTGLHQRMTCCCLGVHH